MKKRFESMLAERLSGRVEVHVTAYSKAACDVGRGWVNLDGREIVSVEIPSFYDSKETYSTETMDFGGSSW